MRLLWHYRLQKYTKFFKKSTFWHIFSAKSPIFKKNTTSERENATKMAVILIKRKGSGDAMPFAGI